MSSTESYRDTLAATQAAWRRLEIADEEARLGRRGTDPHGIAFRQVDLEVREEVRRLWAAHEALVTTEET